MAAHIYHGAPGSFKSASAVWFRVLDELRKGRLVVTNIEGMCTKETIEIELNETFPESADIWRLSSQSEKGKFLWRRWFWWMPVKAFIIMDEVQDIFPADTTVFKPIQFDVPDGQLGIEVIKDQLPQKFYDYFKSALDDYSPELDEDLVDDSGEVVLDEQGNMIYPPSMREANMRHRKYNWDLVYCTPEITEIHKLVRSVCEFAYAHKYFEMLEFIPYFKRRPRIHEHSPKSTGYPKKKDDPTKWRKIPLQVHKLYRSTSTGKVSSAGGGVAALKSPTLIFSFTVLLLCFSYAGWYLFIKEDRKSFSEYANESDQTSVAVREAPTVESGRVSGGAYDFQDFNENDFSLKLPYQAEKIYFNGYVDVMLNKSKKYKEYFFTVYLEDNEFRLNDVDLQYFGIKVHFINECAVKLFSGDKERIVYCEPKKVLPVQQQEQYQTTE